jgi:hypothetical protein
MRLAGLALAVLALAWIFCLPSVQGIRAAVHPKYILLRSLESQTTFITNWQHPGSMNGIQCYDTSLPRQRHQWLGANAVLKKAECATPFEIRMSVDNLETHGTEIGELVQTKPFLAMMQQVDWDFAAVDAFFCVVKSDIMAWAAIPSDCEMYWNPGKLLLLNWDSGNAEHLTEKHFTDMQRWWVPSIYINAKAHLGRAGAYAAAPAQVGDLVPAFEQYNFRFAADVFDSFYYDEAQEWEDDFLASIAREVIGAKGEGERAKREQRRA